MSEVKASHSFIRISPYKLRRVADLVRGQSVLEAEALLKNLPHKGARIIFQVLHAAIANASHNFKMEPKELIVSEILVNEGPKMKRFQPRARGRIYQILKRTSHLNIKLGARKGR